MPKYGLVMPQEIWCTLCFILCKVDNDQFAGNQNSRASKLPIKPIIRFPRSWSNMVFPATLVQTMAGFVGKDLACLRSRYLHGLLTYLILSKIKQLLLLLYLIWYRYYTVLSRGVSYFTTFFQRRYLISDWTSQYAPVPASQMLLAHFTRGKGFSEIINHILPFWASLAAQLVKNLPALKETWVWSLSWEDPYQLQYSGLENSMDCIVHGVANSWTWLGYFHFHPPIFTWGRWSLTPSIVTFRLLLFKIFLLQPSVQQFYFLTPLL